MYLFCPLVSCCQKKVQDSDITAEIVEQLQHAGPKISGIIEANAEGDAGMLEALFKVRLPVCLPLCVFSSLVTPALTGWPVRVGLLNQCQIMFTSLRLRALIDGGCVTSCITWGYWI